MKCRILKENFQKGLSIVEKAVGRSLALPILNNVLLVIEKNFLKLTTTDLEIGINFQTLVKTEKEGKVVIPAKLLVNFISLVDEETITLEEKKQTLYIETKNYKTQIKGLNPEDFPLLPKISTTEAVEINNFPFCQGVSQVVDFCSPTQTRPELAGVYFNFKRDELKIAATDSFRLAEKTLSYEKKLTKEYSLILPQKATRELINIFSEREGKLKIYFSPNQVLFEALSPEGTFPQIQLISRLIEGEYPNYQEVIPKEYKTQLILLRTEFLNQIRTASLFSGKTNEIKIKVIPKEKGIEIFAQSPELGENRSFLFGKINGPELEVAFNFRFLIEGLLNMKSPEVIFELNGPEGPAVLKPVGDLSYLYVVMPIRVT